MRRLDCLRARWIIRNESEVVCCQPCLSREVRSCHSQLFRQRRHRHLLELSHDRFLSVFIPVDLDHARYGQLPLVHLFGVRRHSEDISLRNRVKFCSDVGAFESPLCELLQIHTRPADPGMSERPFCVRSVYDWHQERIRRRIIISSQYAHALLVIFCVFPCEIRFEDWLIIIVPLQDCVSLRQHICDRVNRSCCVASVYHLQTRKPVFVRRDVYEIARGHQCSEDRAVV